jgi:hypothetical protein
MLSLVALKRTRYFSQCLCAIQRALHGILLLANVRSYRVAVKGFPDSVLVVSRVSHEMMSQSLNF